MPRTPDQLSERALELLRERHLATLATLRADGTPHVVAVGFTYDPDQQIARVITSEGNQKVRNAEDRGYGALTQVDGPRWLTVEGPVRVRREPDQVVDAERRYADRYRVPKPNPRRVVIEMSVRRILGASSMFRTEAD